MQVPYLPTVRFVKQYRLPNNCEIISAKRSASFEPLFMYCKLKNIVVGHSFISLGKSNGPDGSEFVHLMLGLV